MTTNADRSLLHAATEYENREPREPGCVILPASLNLGALAQMLSDRGVTRLTVASRGRWYDAEATVAGLTCEGISNDLGEAIAMAVTAALAVEVAS